MNQPIAAYVRISKDRYNTGVSTTNQLEEIQRWCARNGYEVGEVFRDNDVSATNGKLRPAFENLLASDWTHAVVVHQDRLLRRPNDLERIISRQPSLYIHQVQAGPLDLTTPSGQMQARIVAAFSAFEVSHKAERQKVANMGKAREGKLVSQTRRFGQMRDGTLVTDEAEAIRQSANDLVAGKASFNSVARLWNDKGLRTTKGGLWTRSNVRSFYKSVQLIGKQEYDGVIYDLANWTPLLSEEVFEQLQSLIGENKVGPLPRHGKYLLSGLLKCGICGMGLTSRQSKGGKNGKYQCPSPGAHVTIAKDKTNDAVKGYSLALLSRRDESDSEANKLKSEVAKLAHEIRKAEAEQNAWINEAVMYGVSPSAIAAREQAFAQQMDERRELLSKLQVAVAPDIFSRNGEGWGDASIEERRGLLNSLFTHIVVHKASSTHFADDRLEYHFTPFAEELASRYITDNTVTPEELIGRTVGPDVPRKTTPGTFNPDNPWEGAEVKNSEEM